MSSIYGKWVGSGTSWGLLLEFLGNFTSRKSKIHDYRKLGISVNFTHPKYRIHGKEAGSGTIMNLYEFYWNILHLHNVKSLLTEHSA